MYRKQQNEEERIKSMARTHFKSFPKLQSNITRENRRNEIENSRDATKRHKTEIRNAKTIEKERLEVRDTETERECV